MTSLLEAPHPKTIKNWSEIKMSSWESEDQYCKTIFAVFDTAL